MSDTRYSAEELRQNAIIIQRGTPQDTAAHIAAMLRQAARDAETLAGIRTWLENKRESTTNILDNMPFDWPMTKHGAMMVGSTIESALNELDRLSRGDA